jgi:hypothetical protein
MGARNVQRDFRKVMNSAGLIGKEWTPRELRQSFVSLLSDERVPLEVISRLVGHRSTTVTETVYRKQLRPVMEGGSRHYGPDLPACSRFRAVVTQCLIGTAVTTLFCLVGATGFEPVTPRL